MNEISIGLFIFLSVVMIILFIISLTRHSKITIITSMITILLSYSLSKICINEKLVQTFSGISSTNTIVVSPQIYTLSEVSYIYLFIALISTLILILYIVQELQYNMKDELEGIDYDF